MRITTSSHGATVATHATRGVGLSLLRAWGVSSRFLLLLILGAVAPLQAGYCLTNGLALTPPMGWSSWNNFECSINEALIHSIADAMATNGMKAAGYQFINLDDCWQLGRDPNGVIMADPTKFPGGMKALADYAHSKGLKLGLYTDRGFQTCSGGGSGSYGYEYLDALTYASWGVDYIKDDTCNPLSDARTDYFNMSQALMKSGRPIVFSICYYPFSSWDPDLGNLARTTGDIYNSFASVLTQLIYDAPPAFAAGPGHWNDPDIMEVGRGGMTTIEDRSHFTLWCILAAPLLAGNDLTTMSTTTLSILTNAEVIAVDQDPAGEQGIQVAGSSGIQVWCKPLGTDFAHKAVALFNTNAFATNITVNWTALGLQSGSASVRDLWAHADLGSFLNSFTTNVPSHGVVLLKVAGTAPALPGVGTNYLTDLQAAYGYVGAGTFNKDKSIGGHTITLNAVAYAKGIGAQSFSGFEYRLGAIASRFQADIGIDDEVGLNGSAIFQVYADGLKIYDSGVLRGGGARQTVNLDVTGVNRLTLGVMDGDDGINSDHADWAGARVTVVSNIPSPPAAPVGLVAREGNPVTLSWNYTAGATNYNIKRSGALVASYTNIGSAVTPVYTDSNVVPGITYYYEVSAINAVGEGAVSAAASVAACSPPVAPTGLTANVSGLQVKLNWTSRADANSYNVLRATAARPFDYIATGIVGATFTDFNVSYGSNYQYMVTANNACAEGAPSAAIAVSTPPIAPIGLLATPGSAAVLLNWPVPSPTVTYTIKRAQSKIGPYFVIASNFTALPYLDLGLTNGLGYYYVISAVNGGGESPNSTPAFAEPCGGWPVGWSDQDIGDVGFAGGASSCSNAFIVQGGGADIWGNADAFNFASTNLSGDGSIVARVTGVKNTDQWAKGGVMFRGSSAPGSAFVDLVASPQNGVNLQYRQFNGGDCGFTGIGTLFNAVWVKLARSGTNFTGSYSNDGLNWTSLGTINITMPGTALAGLAVTAHNNSALCVGAFDNVATTTPVAPGNLLASPGNASVILNWAPAPGAFAYRVKRSATIGGPYSVLTTLASNFYADKTVTNGGTYFYVVSALNGIGESVDSAPVVASPRPPPALTFSSGSGQLYVSWSASATGFVACSASNLNPPIQWQVITNIPGSNNGLYKLSIPIGNGRQFFRLQSP